MTLIERVLLVLRSASFRVGDESDLQRDVAEYLGAARVGYTREVSLDRYSRIDFWIPTGERVGIGLELKVGGTAKELLRQLLRYARHDSISELIIASTNHSALKLPAEVNGKRLHAVHLRAWL